MATCPDPCQRCRTEARTCVNLASTNRVSFGHRLEEPRQQRPAAPTPTPRRAVFNQDAATGIPCAWYSCLTRTQIRSASLRFIRDFARPRHPWSARAHGAFSGCCLGGPALTVVDVILRFRSSHVIAAGDVFTTATRRCGAATFDRRSAYRFFHSRIVTIDACA